MMAEYPAKETTEFHADALGSARHQYIATFIVTLCSLLFGMSAGWSSIAVPTLMDSGFTVSQTSWLVSAPFLVAIPATLIFGTSIARWGLKPSTLIVALFYLIYWILTFSSQAFEVLLTGRILCGLSVGGGTVIVPLFISHIASHHLRGSLGIFFVVMVNLGLVIVYSLGTFLHYSTVSVFPILVSLMFGVGIWWLPETPVCYLKKGDEDLALESLAWYRSTQNGIREELDNIKSSLQKEGEETMEVSVKDIFSSRGTIKSFILGLVLFTNQQFSGMFAITSYTVTIFEDSGSSLSPSAASIIVGLMVTVGSVGASFLVDRVGRRALLMLSDCLMSVSMLLLGIYYYFKSVGTDVSAFSLTPLACLSVFVIGFNMGMGGIPVVLVTEIFERRLHNLVTTIFVCYLWSLCFTVNYIFLTLIESCGIHGTYFISAGICFTGLLIVALAVPETKGRPLEEIVQEFQGKKPNPSYELKNDNMMH